MNDLINDWLKPPFDEDTREAVKELLKRPDELHNAFYTKLSFGTGGMRGLMGVGTNRINQYTIGFITEGLARYLTSYFHHEEKLKVFVGFDCRRHSKHFAKETALVLAGHGIHVFLTDSVVTTPFTSYACRTLSCHAAVMITASHNPKEYNGYKIYWQDGGQILSPHDVGIEKEIHAIHSPYQVKRAKDPSPLIELTGSSLKKSYRQMVKKELLMSDEERKKEGASLKVVYTNLHGTGTVFIPDLMSECGFSNFYSVKAQEQPDGSFSTVNSPNPEEESTLELGIKELLEQKGDILIATDPDADRMRAGVRVGEEVVLLNGQQIASLLLYYQLSRSKFPSNAVTVKSLVTTELFRKISEAFGIPCLDVLPGFKYIGQLIHSWENGPYTFLFGGEESYGTLKGTFCRDKDGVLAALLITEAALSAKLEGKTLLDLLEEQYTLHGRYKEKVYSLQFSETQEGREEMKRVMDDLRSSPPTDFDGVSVIEMKDYYQSMGCLPPSNILLFRLEDGSKIVVRPSGTEPKIKIYTETTGKLIHPLKVIAQK